MLISLIYLLQNPADGLQRFHNYIQKAGSFSVQINAKSAALNTPGQGTFTLVRPGSMRLEMTWGPSKYVFIKGASGSVEYESSDKLYQQYPALGDLQFFDSVFPDFQSSSFPMPLVNSDLKRFVPANNGFKLMEHTPDTETYDAKWTQGEGRAEVRAKIASDGRLLLFQFDASSPAGEVHRTMEFTNYNLAPKVAPDAFNAVPPLGYTESQFDVPAPSLKIGQAVHLGSWNSTKGATNVDSLIKGKLLIAREPNSAPSDGLIAYLGKQKLSVPTVVLSLGNSGGDFNTPNATARKTLGDLGTPYIILVGKDGTVKGLWLGFDPERADALRAEIIKAAKGTPE